MKHNAMRAFWALVSLLLLIVTAAPVASDDAVKVPFLFSEDERLAQTDLLASVPRSSTVANEAFLNSPMTRLDYLMMQLEAILSRDDAIRRVRHNIAEAFEPVKDHDMDVRITGYVRYRRDSGRVVVGYQVENLGRPRSPMRATCDKLLSSLSQTAPQELIGFLYHNTALGVLAQTDYAEYNEPLVTLASSVVHQVNLESKVGKPWTVYHLRCLRSAPDAKIVYARYSFKLPDTVDPRGPKSRSERK